MNPGDVVQLKSGGPAMTVVALLETRAKLVYYEGGFVDTEIELDALELVEDDEEDDDEPDTDVAPDSEPDDSEIERALGVADKAIGHIRSVRDLVRLNDFQDPSMRYQLLKLLDEALTELVR